MNIKPEELRLGNLFVEKYSQQIIEVLELKKDSITFSGEFKDQWQAEPILITEEWLFNFGFIDTSGMGNGCRIGINISDELCYSNQDGMLRYQTKGSGFTRDYGIKFVHQLQNLYFALTQEDIITKSR